MIEGPAALRALMADIGPRWASDLPGHSQQVKDAYAPLLAAAPKDGIAVTRDVAYGPHARHRLDLFRPVGTSRAPVVAFVHGGAFVRGDKRTSTEIYDNVLYWFARQGFVGANIEYRLAPEAPYPEGALDVASAMAWLHGRVAEFGGDPARMYLIGHSAGGTHVAGYTLDPGLRPGACHARAIVLVSARLEADQSPANPNAPGVRAYFGDDISRYAARSPMRLADRPGMPVLIALAEFENPLLDVYALGFAHRLAAAGGRAPRVVQMRGHNHMSIMAHFNSGEEALGREIVGFFGALPDSV
ncbi:alpha/beta hydrolase [Variovorax sp. JS1663]|uniref:alpha/beta hydrolase n=1 Tax=Variovorax sp. JS1663 TaxID=1851577 RepID=UPI000B6FE253|nr:alpha/beta hydrolase [Variovorax sp. JS1663]OUL99957.1 lipase [Variovorax sp. JS1663]